MILLPAIAVHRITTSHPHDWCETGPEYEGRQIAFAWLGLLVEFTIARRTPPRRKP